MTEPRMRARLKGQQFPTEQLEDLLYAFGSPVPCLPETVRVLDELITDFIIELCHSAALSSQLAHRAKIKADDFRFALRKDTKKLGRVAEMQQKDKDIKIAKKSMQEDVVAEGMVREEKKGKARGKRGREEEVEDGEEEGLGSQSGIGAKRRKKKVGKGRSAVKSEGGEDEEADEDGGDE